MQINFNPNNSNRQNFCMAVHADTLAKNALRVRVSSDLEWKAINDLVSSQEKNLISHIGLSALPNTTKLSGWVSSNGKVEEYIESWIFSPDSPVAFIKRLCDRADDLARLNTPDEINPSDVLNRLG